MNNESAYWKLYYDNEQVIDTGNRQRNVGRTRKGQPISKDIWDKTIDYIVKQLGITKSSRVLELCCGNGQVIGYLAPHCAKAVGVDYSSKLLSQMREQFKNVEAIHHDVNGVSFKKASFDAIVIYFSIQHFDEKSTVLLVQRCLEWLAPGGRLLIGDIPDATKKWQYIDKPAYRKDYIERVVADRPMIGTWFDPAFFEALGAYFDNVSVKILKQPSYQINSTYRFDATIKKEGV